MNHQTSRRPLQPLTALPATRGSYLRAVFVTIHIAAISLGAHLAAQGPEIRYVYDEVGRLVAAIDQTGQAAVYTYDAVGNVLSITRHSASTVTLLDFTPATGPAATLVRIVGLGFGTTPAQHTVTFNGVSAVVSSASPTQLTVTVPSGATTGHIAVVSPNGQAISAAPFVVGAGNTPQIINFSPQIGKAGGQITLTGSGYSTTPASNRTRFNVTTAQVLNASPTTLTTVVPLGGTSGPITLVTSFGTAVTPGDFFVPPGNLLVSDVTFTGRLVTGQPQLIALPVAARVGLAVFDLPPGHRLGLRASSVSIFSTTLTVLRPEGTTLVTNSAVGTSGTFLEATIPSPATHTVLIDPNASYTGNMTLTLYDVPADSTGTIVPGGSAVTISPSTPGENAQLTFAGAVGQKVSLRITASTIAQSYISIRKPDGTHLVSPIWTTGSSSFLNPVSLPAAGTYTIFVDPYLVSCY